MDEVVEALGTLEAAFLERGDRRSIFLTLYGTGSAGIRDRLAAGAFADTEWEWLRTASAVIARARAPRCDMIDPAPGDFP